MFIHYRKAEAYVNQNIIPNASFGYVVQADFFADTGE